MQHFQGVLQWISYHGLTEYGDSFIARIVFRIRKGGLVVPEKRIFEIHVAQKFRPEAEVVDGILRWPETPQQARNGPLRCLRHDSTGHPRERRKIFWNISLCIFRQRAKLRREHGVMNGKPAAVGPRYAFIPYERGDGRLMEDVRIPFELLSVRVDVAVGNTKLIWMFDIRQAVKRDADLDHHRL